VPRFAIAPLGLTTEGSTKFKLKGWKCYLKKLQCSRVVVGWVRLTYGASTTCRTQGWTTPSCSCCWRTDWSPTRNGRDFVIAIATATCWKRSWNPTRWPTYAATSHTSAAILCGNITNIHNKCRFALLETTRVCAPSVSCVVLFALREKHSKKEHFPD